MPKFSLFFCCLFFAFLIGTAESAPGSHVFGNADASASKKKSGKTQQIISSQEAIKRAKKKTGGKVLGVKLRNKNGKSTYKVRVLTDKKRVKNVSIKANKSTSNNKKIKSGNKKKPNR